MLLEILDDPNIDCIYIPLPNSHHFEWAIRAIRAGKHVLLEKPSVSNATEAEILFRLPELAGPNAPVLLEGFHFQFFPAWTLFKSLINPVDVIRVSSTSILPWWIVGKDNIAFNYLLSGGNIMNLGTYSFSALRQIFGTEPEECLKCEAKAFTDGVHDKCDYEVKATFRFPNGGIGEVNSSMQGDTILKPGHTTVQIREVVIPDDTIPASREKVRSRELTLWGMVHGVIWHRIDVRDIYVIRSKDDQKVVRKWQENTSHKAYTFGEAGSEFADLPGEAHWMSFRHQLEQFVNRVKGRETQHWISGEDSIAQMKMIDMAYEKSGLGARSTSTYKHWELGI